MMLDLYVALASLSVCPVFHCVCLCERHSTRQTAQQRKDEKKRGQYLSLYMLK